MVDQLSRPSLRGKHFLYFLNPGSSISSVLGKKDSGILGQNAGENNSLVPGVEKSLTSESNTS